MLRQGAKVKLQQMMAPLMTMQDSQALAFQAFGTIRPRISLRFEECGLTLRGGHTILSGVTGYFGHSKVIPHQIPENACFVLLVSFAEDSKKGSH